MTKPISFSRLGLPLSEKQIPQVIEKYESGEKPKEALERAAVRVKQVEYPAAWATTYAIIREVERDAGD